MKKPEAETFLKRRYKLLSFLQKEPLEAFYKQSCSKKFCNICRKKTVLESVFIKVAGLRSEDLLKADSNKGVFL